MANADALRELQARLATQLQAARTQARGRAWLAVECADAGFLLPLAEAGEISAYRGSVDVPHTRPWFLGVSNLRGQLHAVVDLGSFIGVGAAGGAAPASAPPAGWLVALNPRLDAQCALRVDRLIGLRREDQLQAVAGAAGEAPPARPAFAGATYLDNDPPQRAWQEVRLAALAEHPSFLDIAAAR